MNTQANNLRPANFVAACLPGFVTHLMTVMRRNPGYLSLESITAFLQATVNKHLLSIGAGFGEVSFGNADSIHPKYQAACAKVLEDIYAKNKKKLVIEGIKELGLGF